MDFFAEYYVFPNSFSINRQKMSATLKRELRSHVISEVWLLLYGSLRDGQRELIIRGLFYLEISIICTSDYRRRYSRSRIQKEKKYFSFGILLAYSYLCRVEKWLYNTMKNNELTLIIHHSKYTQLWTKHGKQFFRSSGTTNNCFGSILR